MSDNFLIMHIQYGTLTEYTQFMQQYDFLVSQKKYTTLAYFLGQNPKKLHIMHGIRQKILRLGALDPADPHTRALIGNDLYEIPTQNGVLFYPKDVTYIHNVIHTDNIYRILPKNIYSSTIDSRYMGEKLIVNYEYFLNKTNPPQSTKQALICIIANLVNIIAPDNPLKFHKKLDFDRIFIERWFEKLR